MTIIIALHKKDTLYHEPLSQDSCKLERFAVQLIVLYGIELAFEDAVKSRQFSGN